MKMPILPSRFENIRSNKKGIYSYQELQTLKSFIFQVEEPIRHIKKMIATMKASNSGAFLVIKGESGIGKTTFLNTLPLYIGKLEVRSIFNKQDIQEQLDYLKATNNPRLIVLENRESFETLSARQLEKEIHAINRFIREDRGKNTIIAWPCNGEEMTREIIQFAGHIGGSSLFRDDSIIEFTGPNINRYVDILKSTFQFFNRYDISDIGVSDDMAYSILNEMDKCTTIGAYLENVRARLVNDFYRLEEATNRIGESFNLIIVVIAGNNPSSDIDFLTKGEKSNIDFERLMSSSRGNIVEQIKKHYKICAIAAKEFDCKIVHIDYKQACEYIKYEIKQKDEEIKRLDKILYDNGIKPSGKRAILETLNKCELVNAIRNSHILKRSYHVNVVNQTDDEFKKLLKIASENDRILNKKICELLKENGYIQVGRVEESFGQLINIRSDMLCSIPGQYFRVEFMWRDSTTSGSIATYVLTKIYNYCNALGLL